MSENKINPRVADRIARILHQAGLTHAFGMPGGEVITLVDAIEEAGINFVLARNETAAAMMAAGSCVNANKPGLLITTLGPGLANAINGIADAWQERTPLLIISGVVEHDIRALYTHQVVDHRSLLASVVKGSFEIEARSAEATMVRAIRLAMTPPFGPVHLDLSPLVAADRSNPVHMDVLPSRVLNPPSDPNSSIFNEIRDRLSAAERPFIIAGFEAARSAANELSKIVETHNIPILTTYKAKGIINENHPASLGAGGLSPKADKILLPLLRSADLILCVGYDPIEMRPGWLAPSNGSHIIEIGSIIDHGMHECAIHVTGPIAGTLHALFDNLILKSSWLNGEIENARMNLRHPQFKQSGWGPGEIFEILQESITSKTTITVDSGAHRILFSQQWRATRPMEVLQSAGWCTMGSAIPLAIGAKLSHPDHEVIAILGDGGFEMTMGECGTLRDQALKVTLIIIQDQGLELIALKQDQSQLKRRGISMGITDYSTIAKSFGGMGMTVTNANELRAAFLEANSSTTFSVITCQIKSKNYDGLI